MQRDFLARPWAVLLLLSYWEGSWFTVCNFHDAFRWICSWSKFRCRLAHWRLRWAEIESEVVQRAGIEHRATRAWFRLKTTKTDYTPIQDEVTVLYIPASICTENGEARLMYMQEYDIFDDKECFQIPVVHAFAILPETKYHKRLTRAHEYRWCNEYMTKW